MRRVFGGSLPFLGSLTVGLAACLLPSEPNFSLTFQVDRIDTTQAPLPTSEVDASIRRLEVAGGFQTPCIAAAGEVRASVQIQSSDIFLEIRYEPVQSCQTGVDSFAYLATLRNVNSGAYRLRVTHALPGEEGTTVLDEVVVI